MEFEKLYKKLEATDISDFYRVDTDFMLEIISMTDIPDTLRIYSTISQWLGNSLRSGVWTYYEIADTQDLKVTAQYLSRSSWKEFHNMFCLGMHDYQSPQFIENFDYPQEWIDESESIDKWIWDNEQKLYEWQREFLLTHRDEVCSL
ncbi:hypothetical protein SAMN02745136_02030 [Anaerocolumna jejuensis DSM 15929]|uniref:DUF4375 domain-containing protein n=1 Tax=Anaerocolumna jejuensis DSM 15929 TaxID=1121322 RepID=A0A1M6QU59_9FIRM|nr:hypothetical protein [Anaerocolumna jejuensis]SHK23640.1 hypothetical protein SAMN02745136_02030 [Anaerocolumna jejuensis DSM 15929]